MTQNYTKVPITHHQQLTDHETCSNGCWLVENISLTQDVASSIRPVTSVCFPSPSGLSRPGPSPSWLACASSVWLPWFVEMPPLPRCLPPWLSASAPAYASPPLPTCKEKANQKNLSIDDVGRYLVVSASTVVLTGAAPVCVLCCEHSGLSAQLASSAALPGPRPQSLLLVRAAPLSPAAPGLPAPLWSAPLGNVYEEHWNRNKEDI